VETQTTINKLIVRTPHLVQIKIEVTPVLRGCVYDPETMGIVEKAEEQFGFAEIQVLSFADLYAGKIMAALDRQHPRDLFDVHELLINEGVEPELMNALVIYLVSHDHAPDRIRRNDGAGSTTGIADSGTTNTHRRSSGGLD
jgi:predicted nucleotidyltransferase component of viral defense system